MRLTALCGLNLWWVMGALPLWLEPPPGWAYWTLVPGALLLAFGVLRKNELALYASCPASVLPCALVEGGWLNASGAYASSALPPRLLGCGLAVLFLYLVARQFRPVVATPDKSRSWP